MKIELEINEEAVRKAIERSLKSRFNKLMYAGEPQP